MGQGAMSGIMIGVAPLASYIPARRASAMDSHAVAASRISTR
jgi:hypothetical protein